MKSMCLLGVLLVIAGVGATARQQQQMYYVYDGTNVNQVRDSPYPTNCNYWTVWLAKTGTDPALPLSRWGAIDGSSASDVMQKLQHAQAMEVALNQWFHSPNLHDDPLTSFNPLGPICVMWPAFTARSASLNQADQLLNRLIAVRNQIEPLLEGDLGLSESNPAKGPPPVGANVMAYLQLVHQASEQVFALEKQLLDPSMYEFNSVMDAASRQMAEMESGLPAARAGLTPAPAPASGPVAGSYVVSFNGNTVQESVATANGTVTIAQTVATSTQTFSFPETDLSGATTAVRQQGGAWIVTVTLPQRAIALHIADSSGYTDDEVVSQVDVFYASAADAEAAARAFSGGH